ITLIVCGQRSSWPRGVYGAAFCGDRGLGSYQARRTRVIMPFRARAECARSTRFRRILSVAAGLCLAPVLAGCLLTERPELAVEIPNSYKEAHGIQTNAPPKLDWWRGFRSKELTDLIEESQSSNFDVAAAVARILQADAASKVASAALYPNAN